jgi:hypothetical protein
LTLVQHAKISTDNTGISYLVADDAMMVYFPTDTPSGSVGQSWGNRLPPSLIKGLSPSSSPGKASPRNSPMKSPDKITPTATPETSPTKVGIQPNTGIGRTKINIDHI